MHSTKNEWITCQRCIFRASVNTPQHSLIKLQSLLSTGRPIAQHSVCGCSHSEWSACKSEAFKSGVGFCHFSDHRTIAELCQVAEPCLPVYQLHLSTFRSLYFLTFLCKWWCTWHDAAPRSNTFDVQMRAVNDSWDLRSWHGWNFTSTQRQIKRRHQISSDRG